jgi:hypothetical protein
MKNFPAWKAFNINNHACVSLEDIICIMADHHGMFGFAWDGCAKELNADGLNGTLAVADLIHDIGDAMQNEGVSYDYIQTNVG